MPTEFEWEIKIIPQRFSCLSCDRQNNPSLNLNHIGQTLKMQNFSYKYPIAVWGTLGMFCQNSSEMHLRFWNVGTFLRSILAFQGLGPKRSNKSLDGAFKKHQAFTPKPSKVHLRFAAICADDQAHKSYLSSNLLTEETRLVQTNYFLVAI